MAAYGYDIYTEKLQQLMRSHLGEQVQCWPVFNGTGANVLGLQAMMPALGRCDLRQQRPPQHR